MRQDSKSWPALPLWGCVLIGGKSKRMGRPKHLIKGEGQTWIERSAATLAKHVEKVVISGTGALPDSLKHLQRVSDHPDLVGPMAGILSTLRTWPEVSWLVVACDQPEVTAESLCWLLSHRHPGVKAVLPSLGGDGKIEPLLAYYDASCRDALEEIARHGSMRINRLKDVDGVVCPHIPDELKRCWRNVNTLSELEEMTRRK